MKNRTVSAIIFTLLLMVTSALPFLLQPVSSQLEIKKDICEEVDNRQAIIIEHRISSSELEELKRKLGIWEEGRNYNKKVDGHGTGLRPPTEEEWAEIAESSYVVEKILLDQPVGTPPSSVDHTSDPWFPPIGNQDGEGSCTCWAVGYYTKTFQEAKEHGWNLTEAEWLPPGAYVGYPTPEYQDRIMSPDFIYHLINDGVDEGSSFYDAITLVCNIGACSWEKMPYDPVDHSGWPPEEAWREAPLYRGNASGFEIMPLETDANITSLKNWLASDHLAVIAVDANQYDNFPAFKDVWTVDNYVPPIYLNHANTIVGYDDGYLYDEEGEPRSGAFKIANSWGEGGWEDIADGCYWISYEAMKRRVEYAMFYWDRIDYDPKLMATFNMTHSTRSECDISIGMGNHSSPLATKSFSDLTSGGEHPFCSNSIVLDITEFEDAVPAVYNQSFFLQIYDQAIPPPHSATHYWSSDGVPDSWFRLGQTFAVPGTGATLHFWTYYEIEENYDWGYVEVHDVDTNQWYTLPGLRTVSTQPENYNNPNCPFQFEPFLGYYKKGRWNAFTGSSGDVYREEMDLTPYAGHTIDLYFTYYTDIYVLEPGWYVDDIEIPEIGFFDDVESGVDGWTYNGWDITTQPSSPDGTLLSFSIEYYDSYISESMKVESASYDVPVDTVNLDYVFADLILVMAGDIDGDTDVDYDDFLTFATAYLKVSGQPGYDVRADFDRDGDVDYDDFLTFAENYLKNL